MLTAIYKCNCGYSRLMLDIPDEMKWLANLSCLECQGEMTAVEIVPDNGTLVIVEERQRRCYV